MIINSDKLREFERSQIARKDITFKDALAIFDSLRREEISLEMHKNPLESIEAEFRIAKAINQIK